MADQDLLDKSDVIAKTLCIPGTFSDLDTKTLDPWKDHLMTTSCWIFASKVSSTLNRGLSIPFTSLLFVNHGKEGQEHVRLRLD